MAGGDVGAGMKRQLDGDEMYGAPTWSKRQRGSQPGSRVVFVRGLPPDCLESELLALCCPFAVVEKSRLLPQQCQAFVQLPDVSAATNLISFYQTRDALIRGKKIFFEFSNRDEISSRPEPERELQAPPRRERELEAPPQQQYQQFPPQAQLQSVEEQRMPRRQPYQAPPSRGMGTMPLQETPGPRGIGPPNQILMVSVSKIEYDVTVEVLHQVFLKFGNVDKIVTFWKDGEFKALVQMESVDQAQAAQAALDGRDIYTGCNQLNIVFSRHPELRVRFNDEHSRDFTNPNLPAGPSATGAGGGRGGGMPAGRSMPAGVDPSARERGDGGYGHAPVSAPGRRDDFDYRRPPQDFGRGDQYRPGARGDRGPPPPRFDEGPSGFDGPRDLQEGRHLPAHSTGRAVRGDTQPSCALICSNIDRQLVDPHNLFTLFGCFGDVLRIKIMFRKRDTALIQFADQVHATSALDHLDGVHVFGKKLRVDFSKHTSVSMPHAGADRFEVENTLDFSSSPLHRYRRHSPEDAVPPCPMLHVSGIPQELQRDQNALTDLFAQFGFVKSFRLMPKNPKMALVEMASLDEAIMAMLRLDNHLRMRVSFSRAYYPLPDAGRPGASGPGGWNGPMQSHPRDRSRDRDREPRSPPGGQFRGERGAPPPARGRDFQPRDNSRRPPPRY